MLVKGEACKISFSGNRSQFNGSFLLYVNALSVHCFVFLTAKYLLKYSFLLKVLKNKQFSIKLTYCVIRGKGR